MKTSLRQYHVVDAIFPIALFFVFAASALAVLLLSANIYRQITEASDEHFTSRTASAYIMEKVRQNDEQGDIQIQTIDGIDCLALTRTVNGSPVITYIYAADGMLKELYVRQDADFSLSDGLDIAPVESLSIKPLGDRLYELTLCCSPQKTFTVLVGEESVP